MSTKTIDNDKSVEINSNKNPYIKVDSQVANQTTTITTTPKHLFGSSGADFAVGAIAGIAVIYFLTNEKANKALLKTVAKGTNILQAGFEELKERFEDAKAELDSKD